MAIVKEVLEDRLRYIPGGVGVARHVTSISAGTVSACGEGYELPCDRRYPGHHGRLWEVDWAGVGGYAIHRAYSADGTRLGCVQGEPEAQEWWREDEAVVLDLRRAAAEAAVQMPPPVEAILPEIIFLREDGSEERHYEVAFERVHYGEVANIKLVFPSGEKAKGFFFRHEQREGEPPLIKEYRHKGGTFVGGSAGAGGGFHVR